MDAVAVAPNDSPKAVRRFVTLVAGFVPHLHWVWFVHLAIDGVLGVYVSRLLRYKREEMERRLQAEMFPAEEPPAQNVSSL